MAHYDGYDYGAFWQGREYEDRADKMAVAALLSRIPSVGSLADIGGGTGRIAKVYKERANRITIVDPSSEQLKHAKKSLVGTLYAEFSVGTAERMPFSDDTFDTAVCTRVFHYIHDPEKAIREIYRVLKPGGYFILEIPNKYHFKNRVFGILRGKRDDDASSHNSFVNHVPRDISLILTTIGFTIIEARSVSNFRSPVLKRIFPTEFLLSLEGAFQKPLRGMWFGPSAYFLARKHGPL